MSQVRILAFQFLLHLKIVDKVFQKNTVTLWHGQLLIWSIYLFFITHDNYGWLFYTRKCKRQHYIYWNYNCTKIIYISSSMALVIARNHERIICKKVLESRAKSGIPFISTYDLLWFLYPFNRVDFFLNAVRWHPTHPFSYATDYQNA